jgi:hypothetical protein
MPSTLIELNGSGGPSSLRETDGLDERLEGEKAALGKITVQDIEKGYWLLLTLCGPF